MCSFFCSSYSCERFVWIDFHTFSEALPSNSLSPPMLYIYADMEPKHVWYSRAHSSLFSFLIVFLPAIHQAVLHSAVQDDTVIDLVCCIHCLLFMWGRIIPQPHSHHACVLVTLSWACHVLYVTPQCHSHFLYQVKEDSHILLCLGSHSVFHVNLFCLLVFLHISFSQSFGCDN